MSNSIPILTKRNITKIKGIEERPVYFIYFGNSKEPSVVVKGEAQKADNNAAVMSVAWSSKVMKNTNNPLVNTKIMTNSEISDFKYAAKAVLTGKPLTSLDGPWNWVKMPYAPGLQDGELWNEGKGGYDIELIQQTVNNLNHRKSWSDLGKICVADIFSGNNDRFDFKDLNKPAWHNLGNFMFFKNGMVGLDTWDPNSGDISNLSKAGLTGTAYENSIKILSANKSTIKVFSAKCVTAVASVIQKRMKGTDQISVKVYGDNVFSKSSVINVDKANIAQLLVDQYTSDFETGFNKGIKDLKSYLTGKKRSYSKRGSTQSLPAGVTERMTILGWNR